MKKNIGRAVLLGAHAAHLVRVLRVRPGQEYAYEIVAQGRVRYVEPRYLGKGFPSTKLFRR